MAAPERNRRAVRLRAADEPPHERAAIGGSIAEPDQRVPDPARGRPSIRGPSASQRADQRSAVARSVSSCAGPSASSTPNARSTTSLPPASAMN
mgnify:CR=1 FL=1